MENLTKEEINAGNRMVFIKESDPVVLNEGKCITVAFERQMN